MKTSIFFILIFISNALVYAGTRDPNISDEKYIKYAQDFHYIVKICGKDNDNSQYCASAVVIKPRFILTAAHVVKDVKNCNVILKDKKYPMKTIIVHKDFKENIHGMYDIAVCESEEQIELDFYPPLYKEKDEKGKVCSMSGYGLHGTFITGAKNFDDKRRAGSNVIDYIDQHLLICSPSRNADPKRTSLEFIIASGDSGGGLFIGDHLAGINSCIMTTKKVPNSDYSTESGHTRISEYIDWITENTRE